jgi:hypothetical protein
VVRRARMSGEPGNCTDGPPRRAAKGLRRTDVPISLGLSHALGMADYRLVTLVGGPMDGREIEPDADAFEVVVTMADHTRHPYRADADGSTDASTFAYVGRIGISANLVWWRRSLDLRSCDATRIDRLGRGPPRSAVTERSSPGQARPRESAVGAQRPPRDRRERCEPQQQSDNPHRELVRRDGQRCATWLASAGQCHGTHGASADGETDCERSEVPGTVESLPCRRGRG